MTLVYGSWETFFSEMIYQTTTTASNLVMTSSFSLGVVPAFATCTAHTYFAGIRDAEWAIATINE
jgi:hypothetical protein